MSTGGLTAWHHGPVAAKGKWQQGIVPRNFHWIITDQLAVCERPGGYGANHRRIRRQEEILWIQQQGFTVVVSLIDAPHNLHNYDEVGVAWLHWPFRRDDDPVGFARTHMPELRDLLVAGGKVLIHQEELGDNVCGLVGAYLLWSGLVDTGPHAVTLMESISARQLGPPGRELVAMGGQLRPGS